MTTAACRHCTTVATPKLETPQKTCLWGVQRAMKGIRSAFRRSRSRVEVTKSGSQWTSPSYFNIVVGGGSSSIQWGELSA